VSVSPRETPDVRLLERIAARDASAVGELYDRYSGLLFSIILRILRDRSEAEDVLQEVFVRVWTRADTYDGRLGAPGAWLTRMARNRAIDKLRAKRVRADVDAQEGSETDHVAELAVTIETPERAAQDKERNASVRNALATLSGEQRALITAAFYEGYTHSELASRFGLPLGTVKTRIRTGMLAMRERLEQAV
jgi:RNA polymerase sigma-70 factor (ECF subfamily)